MSLNIYKYESFENVMTLWLNAKCSNEYFFRFLFVNYESTKSALIGNILVPHPSTAWSMCVLQKVTKYINDIQYFQYRYPVYTV